MILEIVYKLGIENDWDYCTAFTKNMFLTNLEINWISLTTLQGLKSFVSNLCFPVFTTINLNFRR